MREPLPPTTSTRLPAASTSLLPTTPHTPLCWWKGQPVLEAPALPSGAKGKGNFEAIRKLTPGRKPKPREHLVATSPGRVGRMRNSRLARARDIIHCLPQHTARPADALAAMPGKGKAQHGLEAPRAAAIGRRAPRGLGLVCEFCTEGVADPPSLVSPIEVRSI
jgi:hypothetical protein